MEGIFNQLCKQLNKEMNLDFLIELYPYIIYNGINYVGL